VRWLVRRGRRARVPRGGVAVRRGASRTAVTTLPVDKAIDAAPGMGFHPFSADVHIRWVGSLGWSLVKLGGLGSGAQYSSYGSSAGRRGTSGRYDEGGAFRMAVTTPPVDGKKRQPTPSTGKGVLSVRKVVHRISFSFLLGVAGDRGRGGPHPA
jgi:hypothetical protein